jgi:uncharacterized protein YegL
MSEQEKQKSSFMQELDQWIDANVVQPLLEADQFEPDSLAGGNVSELQTAIAAVKRSIREKVLQSYRNGQAAGPRKPLRERREAFQR